MPDGIDPARSTGEHSGIWQAASAADDSERVSESHFSRLRGWVLRLFPAFFNEITTAYSTAFCFVAGWLLPIDPSSSHSCISVLILLLTTAWLVPFFSGMIFLQSVELHLLKLRQCRGRVPRVGLTIIQL